MHDYAQRVFTGRRPDREVDFNDPSTLQGVAVPKPELSTEISEVLNLDPMPELNASAELANVCQLDLTDIDSSILVLTNALRLLKMLVCKQASQGR